MVIVLKLIYRRRTGLYTASGRTIESACIRFGELGLRGCAIRIRSSLQSYLHSVALLNSSYIMARITCSRYIFQLRRNYCFVSSRKTSSPTAINHISFHFGGRCEPYHCLIFQVMFPLKKSDSVLAHYNWMSSRTSGARQFCTSVQTWSGYAGIRTAHRLLNDDYSAGEGLEPTINML